MHKIAKQFLTLGLALAPAALFAQDSSAFVGPEGSIGYMVNLGNDMKGIKDGTGYSLGLGYLIRASDQLMLRPHLSTVVFEGVSGSGMTRKRPNFFGGLDVIHSLGSGLSVGGGVFGMVWNQGVATAPNFVDSFNEAGTQTSSKVGSMKIGARVGLEYLITKELSAQAYYHVSEYNLRYNPSWLTVGLGYRF